MTTMTRHASRVKRSYRATHPNTDAIILAGRTVGSDRYTFEYQVAVRVHRTLMFPQPTTKTKTKWSIPSLVVGRVTIVIPVAPWRTSVPRRDARYSIPCSGHGTAPCVVWRTCAPIGPPCTVISHTPIPVPPHRFGWGRTAPRCAAATAWSPPPRYNTANDSDCTASRSRYPIPKNNPRVPRLLDPVIVRCDSIRRWHRTRCCPVRAATIPRCTAIGDARSCWGPIRWRGFPPPRRVHRVPVPIGCSRSSVRWWHIPWKRRFAPWSGVVRWRSTAARNPSPTPRARRRTRGTAPSARRSSHRARWPPRAVPRYRCVACDRCRNPRTEYSMAGEAVTTTTTMMTMMMLKWNAVVAVAFLLRSVSPLIPSFCSLIDPSRFSW